MNFGILKINFPIRERKMNNVNECIQRAFLNLQPGDAVRMDLCRFDRTGIFKAQGDNTQLIFLRQRVWKSQVFLDFVCSSHIQFTKNEASFSVSEQACSLQLLENGILSFLSLEYFAEKVIVNKSFYRVSFFVAEKIEWCTLTRTRACLQADFDPQCDFVIAFRIQ